VRRELDAATKEPYFFTVFVPPGRRVVMMVVVMMMMLISDDDDHAAVADADDGDGDHHAAAAAADAADADDDDDDDDDSGAGPASRVAARHPDWPSSRLIKRMFAPKAEMTLAPGPPPSVASPPASSDILQRWVDPDFPRSPAAVQERV
jgi:hypothetical protein